MSVIRRLAAGFTGFRRGFEDYDEKKWLDFQRGPLTLAGARVNEVSALRLSSVFAAVSFLANAIASLPFVLYRRRSDGGKAHAEDHPLYDRLHNKPNDSELTSWQWRFTGIVHKTLWGNWYTHIDRASYQRQQLFPLLPDRTYPDPVEKTRYVTLSDGKPIYIDRADMLHIPHFSLDGVCGKGVIHYARESLGVGRALDEFAARFFGNGIHPGGFVEIDKPLDEATREGLQKDFNEKYRGLGKAHSVILMTGGSKYKGEELDPEKAQALESRQFAVVEVARWFGLPPHVLRDLLRATFSNIEQQGLELVIYSLLPLVTQIEQAANISLFDDEERRTHYVKLELKGLLRGDLQARTAFYTAMLDRGVFHADDVLEFEDMNPQRDGLGQAYLVPLNMVNKTTVVGGMARLTIEPTRMRDVTPKRAVISAPARVVLQRSSALRRKITIAYDKQWEAYAASVIDEECELLHAGIEQWLGERSIAEFTAWLDGFYADFRKRIDELAAPLLTSYAGAILPVAQQEVNSDADLAPQFDAFVADYRDTFVRRHVGHSRAQLEAAVTEAENPKASAEELLEKWESARPDTIKLHETVRAESALARSVFALAGIMKIRSVHFGTSCPYCAALDGRVIGISEAFLQPGNFQPEGADRPLVVTSTHRHPPYHSGCDCGIEAST